MHVNECFPKSVLPNIQRPIWHSCETLIKHAICLEGNGCRTVISLLRAFTYLMSELLGQSLRVGFGG